MEFTEEQILLRALSRGDEKAFEVLFMRYFPTYQHFIGERLFHQAFEVADVFL